MRLMLFTAVTGGAFGAPLPVPDDVELTEGVVYGTGGGQELKLTLILPKAEATELRPGVMFYHGGGWKGGGPNQFYPQAFRLAQLGYVCASARYRMLPEWTFPACVEDAKCALRWFRANAAKWHLDPDRIAASGGSAGGHLAAMVAYSDGMEGDGGNPSVSSKVKCLVGFNPVLDLVDLVQRKPGNPLCVNFIGQPYEEAPELYQQASPSHWVDADCPPTLLLHGDKDTTVPYPQAVDAVAKLKELGVPAELFTAEGVAHAFFNKEPWLSRCCDAMEKFLKEHL